MGEREREGHGRNIRTEQSCVRVTILRKKRNEIWKHATADFSISCGRHSDRRLRIAGKKENNNQKVFRRFVLVFLFFFSNDSEEMESFVGIERVRHERWSHAADAMPKKIVSVKVACLFVCSLDFLLFFIIGMAFSSRDDGGFSCRMMPKKNRNQNQIIGLALSLPNESGGIRKKKLWRVLPVLFSSVRTF